MPTAVQSLTGTYAADPIHSNFAFAVKYMGVSTFRGTLDDVSVTVTAGEQGIQIEGAAKVESISIRTPEQFRAHVLGDDFFAADRHPEIAFRSTQVSLNEDGSAEVAGELTIKGVTRPASATGTWSAPTEDAMGNTRAHLHLETTVNRHDFGISWNAPLPKGGNALADDVTLTIDAALVAQA
jgi:polyisoprenoid-binding protein YceI